MIRSLVKNILVGGAFILFVASPVLAVTSPVAPTASAACDSRLLGIPPWYRGLTTGTGENCEIKTISSTDGGNSSTEVGLQSFIWTVVLNIIEMALVIVAYIAVFFIIYGGFLFMTGGSNPGQVEKARKSIMNAVIGLVIAMGAIAINNLLFSIIT